MSTNVRFHGSTIEHDSALAWCWKNVGTQSIRWSWNNIRQQDGSRYYMFTFENEDDAVLFKLRWS